MRTALLVIIVIVIEAHFGKPIAELNDAPLTGVLIGIAFAAAMTQDLLEIVIGLKKML